ncbi:hypothetical protein ACFPM0_13810 [Pseudonocardia sulfidoxydans]|uniref:hypothetical protein n=1 Tax=Pseudonocardia sulfidoxydans TaxID=54011 RepID=UPI00361FF7A3
MSECRETGRLVERHVLVRRRGRLDEPDPPEIDLIHHTGRVALSSDAEGCLLAPVAQECVPMGQPDQRPHTSLLQRSSHDHDGVETGAHSTVQDLSRCPHLLAVVGPARRGLDVGDPSITHRLVHGSDDLVDALRP